MKLGLKDAYYPVPINIFTPSQIPVIYFQEEDNQVPRPSFSIKSAPRAFKTRLITPIIAHIRPMGIQVVFYLEKILSWHEDPSILQSIFKEVTFLERLDSPLLLPTLRSLSYMSFDMQPIILCEKPST